MDDSNRCVFGTLLLALAIGANNLQAQDVAVVVPSEVADEDGSGAGPDDFARTPFRVQFIYDADEFADVPSSHGLISAFVLRPDVALDTPQTVTYEDIEIRLSTTDTDVDGLEVFFEDNIGPDQTLVFEGELEVSTQATGPPDGPRGFDYVYPFQTPFPYDPTQGNLLLDVISFSGQDISQREDQDFGVPGLFNDNPEAEDGALLTTGIVTQFLFISDGVAGDFDGNGQLDAADIDALSAEVRSGNNTASFDLNGDQVVNQQDRTFWVDDLRRTYFGDSDLDGEFGSSDFVLVFQAGEYEDGAVGNSTWATGDWDGDGEFGSGDFVTAFQAGGFELGPRPSTHAVPEPAGWILIPISLIALGHSRGGGRHAIK